MRQTPDKPDHTKCQWAKTFHPTRTRDTTEHFGGKKKEPIKSLSLRAKWMSENKFHQFSGSGPIPFERKLRFDVSLAPLNATTRMPTQSAADGMCLMDSVNLQREMLRLEQNPKGGVAGWLCVFFCCVRCFCARPPPRWRRTGLRGESTCVYIQGGGGASAPKKVGSKSTTGNWMLESARLSELSI